MRLATVFTLALLSVAVGGEGDEDLVAGVSAVFPTPPSDDPLCARHLVTCEQNVAKLVTTRERLTNETIALVYRNNALLNEKIGLDRTIKMLRHRIENPHEPPLNVPRAIACAFPGRVGFVPGFLGGGPCRGLLVNCRKRAGEEKTRVQEKKAAVKEQRERLREAKRVNKGLKETVRGLYQQLAAVTENLLSVPVKVTISPTPTSQTQPAEDGQKHPNEIFW